ncbi:forkhead box protein N1 [Ambystoma mexicanum]|uniref:forkhead box protein N1 n=1 Tax=Ambystoma mexicanum TaxID=8296 RepID=UPI0037E99227
MVNSQTGLQDQPNGKNASDSPENECHARHHLDEDMQIRKDSLPSPSLQTDQTSFLCQTYRSESGTDRIMSERSRSPSPHPPLPQDHRDFPTNQGIVASSKYNVCTNEKFRRYSSEETTDGQYEHFRKNGREQFHPYKRQFSENVFLEDLHPMVLGAQSYKNGELSDSIEMMVSTRSGETESLCTSELPSEHSWYNTNHDCSSQIMGSALKLKASLLVRPQQDSQAEMYCYQPSAQQIYCSSQPFHQYSSGGSYPLTYITSTHYPYQRIAPQVSSESQQPLFPKPIYSYSILIFMALRNSKNGSLPVSEIYNFMTEHFPYFKTAPDGWKNSVRHNLSLNKCFEKVENKSGSSSRKGCLWALNPAKIDKMQEELQKWKRKDPVAVRKSMAKPEELDRLIGNKTEKMRTSVMTGNGAGLSSHISLQMSMQSQNLCDSASTESAESVHASCGPQHDEQQLGRRQSSGDQHSCYTSAPQAFQQISPSMMQQSPGISQTRFPPLDHQEEIRAQNSNPQDSPIHAHTPPMQSIQMLTELPSARTIQDTLMEGDLSNDIDALNPSLTDFELHGNLWEELKDDSLSMDPLILVTTSPVSSHYYPQHYANCLTGISTGSENDLISPVNKTQLGLTDLHLTRVYSSFMELDAVSTTDLKNSGSKPVALV